MKVKFIGSKIYRADNICFKPGQADIVDLPDEHAKRVLSEHPDMFQAIPVPKAKHKRAKKDKKSESKKDEKQLDDTGLETILEMENLLRTKPEKVTKDSMNDFAAKFFPELNMKPHLKKATMISRLIKVIEESL